MSSIKGPGVQEMRKGDDLRVAIVYARWNATIISSLIAGAKQELLAAGVREENIFLESVPGSYELPFAVQRIFKKPQGSGNSTESKANFFDAAISIGTLIKGETMHFEYISDTVSQALMRVQLDTGIPVIFGVLTVLTEQQALERAGLAERGHNHGEDWGRAAVEMGVKNRS